MTAVLGTLDEKSAPVPMQTETAATAVAAREKAAVEARFIMAVGRPRDTERFRIKLIEACKRPGFAEVAVYAKPVGGGKKAEGPSIRFAEEAARNYGNLDIQSPVVFDDHERRIIRVSATDLETNTSYSRDVHIEKSVERRNPRQGDEVLGSRTNSTGQTVYRIAADEDALLTKQGAQVSKATREVIMRVLPGDVVEEAVAQVKETLRTQDAKDPTAARKRLVDAFYALAIMPAQLADLLGHPLDAVTPAEIGMLRTIYTALKEGETSWTDVLESFGAKKQNGGETTAVDPHAKGTEALKAKLDRKRGEVKEQKDATGTAAAPGPEAAAGDGDLALDQELKDQESAG
jgi:hypothetical protein